MPTQGGPFVAPGENVYFERFDPQTGQRTSRIRADRYQELSDGRWLVARPEADFFLRNGQVLRISGGETSGVDGQLYRIAVVRHEVSSTGTRYGATLVDPSERTRDALYRLVLRLQREQARHAAEHW